MWILVSLLCLNISAYFLLASSEQVAPDWVGELNWCLLGKIKAEGLWPLTWKSKNSIITPPAMALIIASYSISLTLAEAFRAMPTSLLSQLKSREEKAGRWTSLIRADISLGASEGLLLWFGQLSSGKEKERSPFHLRKWCSQGFGWCECIGQYLQEF